MTTMDVTSGFPTQPIWQDLVGAQIAGWQTFLRRREEHRRVAAISRLGPRLIRDMGLDPERIHEALEGTWEEVQPVAFRLLLPRDVRV